MTASAVGGVCLGTVGGGNPFCCDLVSFFKSSLLFPGAVGASGFVAMNCSLIVNMSLLTIVLSIEVTPNYPGQWCKHQD